jgi:hypothetical protein
MYILIYLCQNIISIIIKNKILAILTETIARSPVEYMPNGVAKTYDLNR